MTTEYGEINSSKGKSFPNPSITFGKVFCLSESDDFTTFISRLKRQQILAIARPYSFLYSMKFIIRPERIVGSTGSLNSSSFSALWFHFSIFGKIYVHLYPRGYLVYLSDGDVPFSRVSFSPIFYRAGYQRKANFLEQVVKTCQKRKFCYNGLLFSQIFVLLSILFTDFFLEHGII